MADNNDLYKAYSILGSATTAEYKRRRKEEEDYRRTLRREARQDRLAGYFLAPIGQQLAQGVSDVISAPFRKPVEKLLQTEQGRPLRKQMRDMSNAKVSYGALGKKITTDYAGDSLAYHENKVDAAIRTQARNAWEAAGYSLSKDDSESTIQFNRFLQDKLKSVPELAEKENNQYLAGKAALSQYKTGQDAADVLAKTTPYSKGPIDYLVKGAKRFLKGDSPFGGPSTKEKERAVLQAKEGLNLSDRETSELLTIVAEGGTIKRLETELDYMSSYKDPEFKDWWERSKDQKNFIQEYNKGELSKSMRDAYTQFVTDKNRPPTRQQVLAMAAEKQDISITPSKKTDYVEELLVRPKINAIGKTFKDDWVDQNFPDKGTYAEATIAIKNKADAEWTKIVGVSFTRSQQDFINYKDRMSAEQADEYVKNLQTPQDQISIILNNAEKSLEFLEKKTMEGKGWLGSSYEAFSGALGQEYERTFDAAALTTETKAIVSRIDSADGPVDITATTEQLRMLTEIDNLQDFNDSVTDLTKAGLTVSPYFVKREAARINALGEGEASAEVVPPPVVGERELSPYLKGTMLASYRPAFGAPDVSNIDSPLEKISMYEKEGLPVPKKLYDSLEDRRDYLLAADKEAKKIINTQIALLEYKINRGDLEVGDTDELRNLKSRLDLKPVGSAEIERLTDILGTPVGKPKDLKTIDFAEKAEKVSLWYESFFNDQGRILAESMANVDSKLRDVVQNTDGAEIAEGSTVTTEDKQQALLDNITRGRNFEETLPTESSNVSNKSSLLVKDPEVSNSFKEPSVAVKENRGQKSEDRNETGLSKKTLRRIDKIVEPIQEEDISEEEKVDKIVKGIRSTRNIDALTSNQIYDILGPRTEYYDEKINGKLVERKHERAGFSADIIARVMNRLYGDS
jgi:hypothetical protein